jgi:hypothetical protein
MPDNIETGTAVVKAGNSVAALSAADSESIEIGNVPAAPHGDAVGSLIVFADARRAIANAETVEEVNKILAMATGLAAAARHATDHELEAEAAVLKLEAERKLGQLMAAQKETVGFSKGGRPKTGIPENPVLSKPPTLAEAGIDKNLAEKARKAAAMPEAAFAEAKEAKRAAVLTRQSDGGGQAKPRKRKSRFDAEHYADVLRNHISQTTSLLEEYPERFEQVLGRLLLSDKNFIDDLVALARHPQVGALAAVAAPLGNGADHGNEREFEIRFIGAQSEITELRARIAELEGQQAEHIQGEPVDRLMTLMSDEQRAALLDRIISQQIAQASPVAATQSSKRLLTNLTGTLYWGLGQVDPANGAQCLKIIAAKLAANKRVPNDVCFAFAKRAK